MKNNFSKQWDAGGGSRSIIQSLNLFTSRNLFKSLKSILMIVALLSLSSNVWGETKTSTVTSSTATSSPVTIDGVEWVLTTESKTGSPSITNAKYSSIYGLKFGSSGSNYWGTVKFSTDYFEDKNITAVTVNILNNGSKSATMTVKQGSTTIGTATKTFGTTWTDLTANTNKGSGGTLEITYQVAQASYWHSITVTFEEGSSYTISATVNNSSYGEVSVSGNTITVEPNTGYCVNTSNPYTVTSGTADVTYNDDNTFTVETEADCSVQVNLKAKELFTVTFFNDKTQLKQVQVYEGDAIGKSNLPSTPSAWHATSTEFAGWTTQFIKGNTQTTINDNQFVDSYTKVTSNMTVYALWASTDATTSTFDASNTSNLTESDDYYEFSENTTGVILGGYDIFTDKGSYFRAAEGDNGDVAIYVQSPNKVIKQVVFTIDGTASSYGIASVTDGSLSSTSSSPQTASNVRTNYMEAYPNGSTIDLKKVVVTTYTNYITNSITYTDYFLELKIAQFLRYFLSHFFSIR